MIRAAEVKRPTSQLRARLIRAAERERRKRERAFDGQIYSDLARRDGELIPRKFDRDHIVQLAGDLSMCSSPAFTLRQLIRIPPPPKRNLFVDLRQVTSFDAPALLLLCAYLREVDWHRGYVSGAYPHSPKARSALQAAGFGRWLHRLPPLRPSKRTLELRDGNAYERITPDAAAAIQTFIEARHQALGVREIDKVYDAVFECIDNVRTHAYPAEATRPRTARRWLAVGWYDEDRMCSSVAILDRGVGIMATLRPKLSEDAWGAVLEKIHFYEGSDYLEMASRGSRTHSRESHHGKGLSTLRKFVVEAPGRRLHVLSSRAAITWSDEFAERPLASDGLAQFGGTIICLELLDKPD